MYRFSSIQLWFLCSFLLDYLSFYSQCHSFPLSLFLSLPFFYRTQESRLYSRAKAARNRWGNHLWQNWGRRRRRGKVAFFCRIIIRLVDSSSFSSSFVYQKLYWHFIFSSSPSFFSPSPVVYYQFRWISICLASLLLPIPIFLCPNISLQQILNLLKPSGHRFKTTNSRDTISRAAAIYLHPVPSPLFLGQQHFNTLIWGSRVKCHNKIFISFSFSLSLSLSLSALARGSRCSGWLKRIT